MTCDLHGSDCLVSLQGQAALRAQHQGLAMEAAVLPGGQHTRTMR
jgi:hypothetical protein